MRTNRLLVVALVAPLAAACAGGPDLSPDAQGAQAGAARVQLIVTRTLPSSADVRVDADARFVRYSGVGADSAQTLAGIVSPDAIALGTCGVLDPGQAVDSALSNQPSSQIDLRLVDAGALRLQIGDGLSLQLLPERAPDILPFLSGVQYGASEVTQAPVLDGADVRFAAAGGDAVDDLGAFGTVATFPSEVRIAQVAGMDPNAGPVVVSLRTPPVNVRWLPDPAPGPDDAVYVELRTLADSAASFACHVADEGSVDIPITAAQSLPDAARGDGSVWLSVTRVRTLSLDAPAFGGSSVLAIGSRLSTPVTLVP
jgi:hypothetical protein